MNNRHGHTLRGCSGLWFIGATQGQGGGEAVQKEPIYAWEKRVGSPTPCTPHSQCRDKALQFSLLGVKVFGSSLYKILTFFVGFSAIICWPEGKTNKQTTLSRTKNIQENMPRVLIIISSFFLCICV